jgi:hypothetical protein
LIRRNRFRIAMGAAFSLVFALAGLLAVAAYAQPQPAPDAGAAAPAPPPAKPPSDTVRIVFTVIPSSKKATVNWGKKKLGAIAPQHPLIITRPRDSGPLDVMVRADGCVPVQTRAYTFADSKVAVKVTPLDQKNTLLGYREELPPDGGAPSGSSPDGGAR